MFDVMSDVMFLELWGKKKSKQSWEVLFKWLSGCIMCNLGSRAAVQFFFCCPDSNTDSERCLEKWFAYFILTSKDISLLFGSPGDTPLLRDLLMFF